MKITIGADPELFIIDESTGKVISAVGIIPGTKKEPHYVSEGYGIETDNILAEFNIPPAKSCTEFVDSIEKMKAYLRDFVKKINPNYGIRCVSSCLVDEDQLQSDEAKQIGCDIDYNVYTKAPNKKRDSYPDNRRVGGMHIHCGYPHNTIRQSCMLVKYMDMYVGIPSILYDDDTVRRSLYGRAGSFRMKPYGIEYRSLGSGMMRTSELVEFVYRQTVKAIEACDEGLSRIDDKICQDAINDSDKETCKCLCEMYHLID